MPILDIVTVSLLSIPHPRDLTLYFPHLFAHIESRQLLLFVKGWVGIKLQSRLENNMLDPSNNQGCSVGPATPQDGGGGPVAAQA